MESKKIILHPTSQKLLAQGHYWVTKDQFTEKFPTDVPLLLADSDKYKNMILLNDPSHPHIKARLWSLKPCATFKKELETRLTKAIETRKNLKIEAIRQNYFLSFGEYDDLPGLFILHLNNTILIQSYMHFWKDHSSIIISILKKVLPKIKSYYWQDRSIDQKLSAEYVEGEKNDQFTINEFGVNYKIDLTQGYDHGIYTDMASFRFKFQKSFTNRKVLNLFSYTGAYSLFALQHGALDVTSVDLSKPYLDWLDENLRLNPQIDQSKHHRMENSTKDALKMLENKKERFDFIICDPPSSSSDGSKRSKALDEYENLLPQFYHLLNHKGLCLIFLNTHKTSTQTFFNKIQSILKDKQLKFSLELNQKLKLDEDCGIKKGFIESDYLKALILKKI